MVDVVDALLIIDDSYVLLMRDSKTRGLIGGEPLWAIGYASGSSVTGHASTTVSSWTTPYTQA